MPGRHLPLEHGGDRRLRLRWRLGYEQVTAELDGREVARIDDRQELRAGRRFPLGDGSQLGLRTDRLLYPALVVERDGRPLPGSDTDPVHVARIGAWTLFFVAAVAFFLGGAAVLSEVEGSDATATVGLAIAVVFGSLGVLLRRGHAWAALVGAGLEIADGVNALRAAVGGEATWLGVLARVAFALILLRAWMVMRREPWPPARS